MTQLKLPDIAAQTLEYTLPLDWVGMCGIALPVQFEGRTAAAKIDAGVSLVDCSSRGIHMSRLYLALETLERQPLTPLAIRQLLADFLSSHEGLSSAAYLRLRFEHLLKRPALISPLAGWKNYAVSVDARLENEMFHVELSVFRTLLLYLSMLSCASTPADPTAVPGRLQRRPSRKVRSNAVAWQRRRYCGDAAQPTKYRTHSSKAAQQ